MIESLGLNTRIVSVLKKYGTVPVDFLAKSVGRRKSEIEDDLKTLQDMDVIKYDGKNVSLSKKEDR